MAKTAQKATKTVQTWWGKGVGGSTDGGPKVAVAKAAAAAKTAVPKQQKQRQNQQQKQHKQLQKQQQRDPKLRGVGKPNKS